MTDYSRLPEHMREGARLYIEHGIKPGSLMTAVIRNDFLNAIAATGSDLTVKDLRDIMYFWVWNAPADCWGSPAAFEVWNAIGGKSGRDAPPEQTEINGCPGFTVAEVPGALGGTAWLLEHPDPMPAAAVSVIGWSADGDGKPLREKFGKKNQAIAVAHKLREILDRLD